MKPSNKPGSKTTFGDLIAKGLILLGVLWAVWVYARILIYGIDNEPIARTSMSGSAGMGPDDALLDEQESP